ncbi:MAG: hypothetical protein JWO13_2228 [Acidobacteriales bacterium]|nr:hypothetical protein [Terriglobales bacterium]
MSTQTPAPNKTSPLQAALANIAEPFRSRLVDTYVEVKNAFLRGDSEKIGLKVGKFCETLLRFLQHITTGTHTAFGTPIKNFIDECLKIEKSSAANHPEGLRVLMPRALAFAYSVRSKRGVGHVGGDIDANAIDAATCVRVVDWCVCELIRVYHKMPLEEAQALLDVAVQRQIPAVWNVMGKKRVLIPGLDAATQTLLLLYQSPEFAVAAEDLSEWIDYSSAKDFRRFVLLKLHSARLIEYDAETDMVLISPTGTKEAERKLLKLENQIGEI